MFNNFLTAFSLFDTLKLDLIKSRQFFTNNSIRNLFYIFVT